MGISKWRGTVYVIQVARHVQHAQIIQLATLPLAALRVVSYLTLVAARRHNYPSITVR
jgi:hypothetical protein